MAEDKIITVTIAPGGKKMAIDMDGFHGVGCGALMEAFDEMGETIDETKKPEYDETNQNYNGAHVCS